MTDTLVELERLHEAAISPITLSWLLSELEGRIERNRRPDIETIVDIAECELRALIKQSRLAATLTSILCSGEGQDVVERAKALVALEASDSAGCEACFETGSCDPEELCPEHCPCSTCVGKRAIKEADSLRSTLAAIHHVAAFGICEGHSTPEEMIACAKAGEERRGDELDGANDIIEKLHAALAAKDAELARRDERLFAACAILTKQPARTAADPVTGGDAVTWVEEVAKQVTEDFDAETALLAWNRAELARMKERAAELYAQRCRHKSTITDSSGKRCQYCGTKLQ